VCIDEDQEELMKMSRRNASIRPLQKKTSRHTDGLNVTAVLYLKLTVHLPQFGRFLDG